MEKDKVMELHIKFFKWCDDVLIINVLRVFFQKCCTIKEERNGKR